LPQERKPELYFNGMRVIFIFLLTAHCCWGQKVQSLDVAIYGSNLGAHLATHAAKVAGKNTNLILPHTAEELTVSSQLHRSDVNGLITADAVL
jgi:hypothetical protein